MIKLEHVSASSITGFVECPARWSANRDQDRKVTDRTKYTDAGNIVHGALEKWRDPERGIPQTWDALLQCYRDVCTELKLTETLGVFKTGLDLLKKAFALSQYHPTIPMNMAKTIAVETEITGYQPAGWPLPLKGFLDHIFIVTPDPAKPFEVILGVEDYKTGKPKTWAELTGEDIQPPSYLAWVLDVLVPHIESLGYKVLKVAMVWTYINAGTAVPMYQADFDIETTKWYIGSISEQMLAFVKEYNAIEAELLAKVEKHGNDGADIAEFDGALSENINEFLAKYEKPNKYCSNCVRKNVCTTFQRLLDQEVVIDLTSPDTSWVEIKNAYDKFKAMGKEADARKKEIEDLIRVALDQAHEEALPIEELGIELTANANENKSHTVQAVAEVLGVGIVLNAASITQDAVNKELARIALTNPEDANQKREELEARMVRQPGARIVRERKIRVVKKKAAA